MNKIFLNAAKFNIYKKQYRGKRPGKNLIHFMSGKDLYLILARDEKSLTWLSSNGIIHTHWDKLK